MTHNEIITNLQTKINNVADIKEKISLLALCAKETTKAKRCSIFIYHKENDQLRSVYADGVKGTIALRSNVGIVGYTFHKKITLLENDTTTSNIFFKSVDQKTNYTTSTVLATPIYYKIGRFGVIQLLNKEEGFNQVDKEFIEDLSQLLQELFHPSKKEDKKTIEPKISEPIQSELQKIFDTNLDAKKLYLMEDGSAYYKILGMSREYFIAADQCYQLDIIEKQTEVYYFNLKNKFSFIDMVVKLDNHAKELVISETLKEKKFNTYSLEEDNYLL